MHDLLWMQVIERIDYLLDNKSFLGTIEFFSLLVKIREEISTFDEIRYNAKILWLWNDSHEKDDVRMSQWCEHIDFVVDFVNQIRCNVGVKYLLDSNTASKIFSCMHDTKSSLRYGLSDFKLFEVYLINRIKQWQYLENPTWARRIARSFWSRDR